VEIRFLVDSNAGKLARWLRIMGYDALFFNNIDDSALVDMAFKEGRVVLTKDTQIIRRRLVTNGQLKVILTQSDDPKEQLRQVVKELKLDCRLKQFTRCLECNQLLVPRSREEVKELVPPYVFRTQDQYMQCPACLRVYWRGTHWQRMKKELEAFACDSAGEQK
jgi:uncharacterized protein with PIN domain